MPNVPQLEPSFWDKAREIWFVGQVLTSRPDAFGEFKRKPGEADDDWFPDVVFMQAYPDAAPVIDPKDAAAVAAWLRIRELVRAELLRQQNQTPPGQGGFDPGKPTWPLPLSPKLPGAGGKFAAKRPWTKPQTRYHAGADLAAKFGTPVFAPEAGVIVAPNSGWESKVVNGQVVGVKSLIMVTDSGYTLLLGGIRPSSSTLKAGDRVAAGQKVAEVGAYAKGDTMLHFQMYAGKLTEAQVNARKSWSYGAPAPDKLIDPSAYLKAAATNPKIIAMMAVPVEEPAENGEDGEGTPEGDATNTQETAPAPSPAGSSSAAIAVVGVLAVVALGFIFKGGR